MSRNNASKSYKIQDLLKQVLEMSQGDLYDLYGVLVEEDGTYFDTCYGKLFPVLLDWVVFNVEMEALEEQDEELYGGYEED